MPKKEDYYILSKGSALHGYDYVRDAYLKRNGKLQYTTVGKIEEASWYKKESVETIMDLDKNIKIQKIVLKDVGSWK